MIELQEQQRQLTTKREELDHRTTAMKTAPIDEVRKFRTEELPRRMEEIKTLHDDIQGHAEMERIAAQNRADMKSMMLPDRVNPFPDGSNRVEYDNRTIGQRFVESDAFKARIENYGTPMAALKGDTKTMPIEAKIGNANIKMWTVGAEPDEDAIKTLLTNTSGIVPFIPRSPRIVPIGQIQPVIADLIPQEQTDVPGGKYLEETTYTNTAARVAEGATKPEATLAFTERSFSMTKIAVTIPITDEQLADVPQIRSIIDNRLSLMVRQTEDDYLLNNTAATGFDGFLQKSGVQNYDLTAGTVPIPTAVLSLMTSIQNSPGFAMVTGLVMNPTDWFSYVTYQISTGAYLVGAPNMAAITQMWGMPIIVTNRMPQGTILLGDFRQFAEILRRQELTIDVGWANDDFLKNIQRVRAEERMVLQIFRANAFGTVTGIAAPA